MGPPCRIDPTTHHTMSKNSYHGATSRSLRDTTSKIGNRKLNQTVSNATAVSSTGFRTEVGDQCLRYPGFREPGELVLEEQFEVRLAVVGRSLQLGEAVHPHERLQHEKKMRKR